MWVRTLKPLGVNSPTSTASLRGVCGVDPDDFTPSAFSLGLKDVQEFCPTRIQNTLTQSPVLHHSGDVQLFNNDQRIQQDILLRHLEMEVPTLAPDLEMCLRNAASSLLASVTAFLSSAQRSLLASQCPLGSTNESRIGNGLAGTVSQKRFQSDINPDCWSLIVSWNNRNSRRCLTHD